LLKAKVESKDEGKPKLIVQNSADDAIDAEVVDDNVPMLLDDKEKK